MQPSPYTPGEVARSVPGRSVPLGQIEERLAYLSDLQRLVGRIRVDQGPRGVGKTSLLHEASLMATRRDILTIWVTAGEASGLATSIAREIDRATGEWSGRRDLTERLRGLDVGLQVGVPGVASVKASWKPDDLPDAGPPAGTREFEDLLVATHAVAVEHGKKGLVLFVDEIQDADLLSLKLLGYGWQDFQRERPDLPAAVFAAGLPSSKQVINDAVSPSERFAFKTLGGLSADAAMIALAGPARELGVEWDHDAVQLAVDYTKGYPHAVQLLGSYAWEAAALPDPGARITRDHVRDAIQHTDDDLQELYDSRLSRIRVPSERDFVRVMSALGDGPIHRNAIAHELGQATTSISSTRQALLNAGVIEEAGRGYLQFTVDGFAAFARQHFGFSTAAERLKEEPNEDS
ncbi:ATP-binding protein [Flexivirga caeni]|nr:ATP-binding protein [Flexivirga caeni]